MHNFENIKEIIASGESETVEFKESLDNSALECIAAFSNTNGGDLYIGVRDDGTIQIILQAMF